MTTITIFEDQAGSYTGFEFDGHAGAAEAGEDIVCAGLSTLGITTVNSIEIYAAREGTYEESASKDGGYMKLLLKEPNHDTQLLIDSMILGLSYLEQQYPQYVRLKRKGGVTDDRI
jgi:uncharacterized protein YsxB (DUF464 family)